MRKRARRPTSRGAVVIAAILAIVGTLCSCGRYGPPVRVASTEEAIVQSTNEADEKEEAEEPSDRPSSEK